jgi:hypothetical protein
MKTAAAILAFLASAAPAQEAPDPAKVKEAVDRGAAFLLKKYEKAFDLASWNSTIELVMLTLSHAEADPGHEVFVKGVEGMLKSKLLFTYRVAAQAMALQRIDPKKHLARIAHCAQYLVDTQLPEGEWGYPGTLSSADETPKVMEEPEAPKVVVEESKGKSGSQLLIRRKPARGLDPKAKGDVSNAQFALLGLKACADAGVEIPKPTWEGALRYFLKTQNRDGGWGYHFGGQKDPQSYASMTCAGVCSLAIARNGLGLKDPLKDGAVQGGLAWLGKAFRPDENVNVDKSHLADPLRWLYYYLYSIERVGRIAGVEDLGKKPWYAMGARFLLEKQKPDGSWWTGLPGVVWKQAGDLETADTCFAILFLTKATPPLTRTEGAGRK